MERAPLRQVPSRPPGPIVPADALRYVAHELPGLDAAAAAALALVALAGRPREEVGEVSGLPEVADLSVEAVAEALTRGRKALRRRLYPLPGSGWCERAERLISDRLDDALEDPGPARLEVHLANCSRCVEHERRLAQSQDALVAGFVEAHPAQEAENPPAPIGPEPASGPTLLRVVQTPALPAPASPPSPPEPPPPSHPRSLPPGAAPAAPLPVPPPPVAEPNVPSTPPMPPPSDPPPAAPSAAWSPPQPTWRSDTPRSAVATRMALESESTWTVIGPLVAVLSVAVLVALLAVVLAAGG